MNYKISWRIIKKQSSCSLRDFNSAVLSAKYHFELRKIKHISKGSWKILIMQLLGSYFSLEKTREICSSGPLKFNTIF